MNLLRPGLAFLALAACAGGAIKQGDDESDFAVTGEIPVKNWERLLEETHTAPIKLPGPERMTAARNARYQAWVNERLLQPALARWPTKDAELRALAVHLTHVWSREEIAGLEYAPAISKLGQEPELPPFLVFIAARSLLFTGHAEEARPLYRRAAAAPGEESFPGGFQIIAQERLLMWADAQPDGKEREAEEKGYLEILRETLGHPWKPEEIEHMGILFFEGAGRFLSEGREGKVLAVLEHCAQPDWLRLSLEGRVHHLWAHEERERDRDGLGHKADWAKVKQHTDTARRLLAEAWKLNPDASWAAHDMMALVQEEHEVANTPWDPAADELRLWFDRTIAAYGDSPSAYGSALNGYSPDWGGSLAKMLAFGRACAETRRYETLVPTYFGEAVARIAAELPDWRAVYRQPGISSLLLETRQRRLAKVAGTPVEIQELGMLAVEAWACGKYELAAKSLRKTQGPDGSIRWNRDMLEPARRLAVDLDFIVGDALCRGGSQAGAYSEAGRLLARGEAAAAEAKYRALLTDAALSARPLLQADLRLAQFREKAETHEWTPLPLDDPLCWRHPQGFGYWIAEKKHLRLATDYRWSRTLFRGRLGERFEVRGHFYNSHGPDLKAGGFGLIAGHTPMGAGQHVFDHWTVRVDSASPETNVAHFAYNFGGQPEAERKRFPWQADNLFLYHYDRGFADFFVNGKEVLRHANVGGENAFTGSGAFGFALLGYGPGPVADVWEVEARLLP